MLGVGLLCAFLPQAVSFWPLAAIFVLLTALVFLPRTRKAALCLLLGIAAGAASVWHTEQTLERTRVLYAGREVLIRAEVLTAAESYIPGKVETVLQLRTLNGNAVDFRIRCEAVPECAAGDLVQGWFILSEPLQSERISLYADGVALEAELLDEFVLLGQSGSFRARTARLQAALSHSLRSGMDEETGGILAAMLLGDRSHLTSALRTAYRGAGLSHVLVVSGLHVSILCGDVLAGLWPRRKREQSALGRRIQALWKALLALLLVGVTGASPSVQRAAVAVWVSSLGVWIHGAPDALTSLAAAGILMTAANSYAVCDVGFELSFAAVLGTLAGAECTRRAQKALARRQTRNRPGGQKTGLFLRIARVGREHLLEAVLISGCASAATFPVLVLRGMSVSLYAVLSSVAVLWMVEPMLLLGLATALTGLLPGRMLYRVLSFAAQQLTGWMNGWAAWLAGKPGAGIYFDTVCAAMICLVLIALFALALHWHIRLMVALPCLMLTAALTIGCGNWLSRDVVSVELVGNARTPSVLITQNDRAVVLFRGGTGAQNRIETALERHGVRCVELVVDLRTDPESPCPLKAELGLKTSVLPFGTVRVFSAAPAQVGVLRTKDGCLVQLTVGNQRFAVLCGEVQLARPMAVQWLIASSGAPTAVQYQGLLALGRYDWMNGAEALYSSLSMRRYGGQRLA